MGASKWAPYGVNIPAFVTLTIASEITITATAVLIFREDSGIWPASTSEGWADVRAGHVAGGLKKMLVGAWDISLVDLRLRTNRAIFYGRANRIAALVPLVYALTASMGGAPIGLRSSAFVDIGLTLIVWAFMEVAMVRPETAARTMSAGATTAPTNGALAAQPEAVAVPLRESYHEVRRVQLEDIDRILEIERIRWGDQAATREMILSRLQAFPEGQLAAIHVNAVGGQVVRRKLVAWSTVMPADERTLRSFGSWEQASSGGTLQNVDRNGNALIGVNLTSVTEGATYILIGEILAAVIEWEKKKLIGGSRLNGFMSFNERRAFEGKPALTADQYARLREVRGFRLNEERIDQGLPPLSDADYMKVARRSGTQLVDDEGGEATAPDYVCSNVRGYMSIPGARLIAVVPNYFADPPSANYGVLIEGLNPLPPLLRKIGPLKHLLARRIRRAVRAELEARQLAMRGRSRRRRAGEPVPEFLRRSDTDQPAPEAAEPGVELPAR
jgi:hypothetical protein